MSIDGKKGIYILNATQPKSGKYNTNTNQIPNNCCKI